MAEDVAERAILGPGDTLVVRLRSDVTRETLDRIAEEISSHEALAGRVICVNAEQLVIVRKGEAVADLA